MSETRRVAVVAYPSLGAEAAAWIEAVRAEHDPQSSLLRAHFTLVFPVEIAGADVFDEVATVARSTSPFAFALRSARAVPDPFGPGYRVFLVPDEGTEQIAALHESLHSGAFEVGRRAHTPYLPHITVGAGSDWTTCAALADELNTASRAIDGRIDEVTLLEVQGARVVQLGAFRLTAPPP